MSDLPLGVLRDLELRYDGPIPAQHVLTEQVRRRRVRGTIAVLEDQASHFIDAAVRCDGEIDDLAADLDERNLARWQRDATERRLSATRTRRAAHIACAAQALSQAKDLRERLALTPHPLIAVLTELTLAAQSRADHPSPAV